MRARVLSLADLTNEDVESSHDLALRSDDPHVFSDLRFLRHFLLKSPNVAGEIRVLVAEDSGRWHGMLPIRRTRGLGKLRLTYATTYQAGGDFQHLVASRDRAAEAVSAIRSLAGHKGVPSLIELHGAPTALPISAHLNDAVVVRDRSARAFVDLTDPAIGVVTMPEGLVIPAHLSRNTRKPFGRRARALAGRWGGSVKVVDRTDDLNLVDTYIEMEASGWKSDPSRGGRALALSAERSRWFRTVVDDYRESGDLRATSLEADGRPAYLSIVLRCAGAWFGFRDATDDEVRDLSPGSLGRAVTTGRFILEGDARFYDPTIHPAYHEATMLYPHRRQIANLLVAPPNFHGHFLAASYPLARRLVKAAAVVPRRVRRRTA